MSTIADTSTLLELRSSGRRRTADHRFSNLRAVVAEAFKSARRRRPMLRSVSGMRGFTIHATDGDMGSVDDFLFDDQQWTIRYLVANTGGWLASRLVVVFARPLPSAGEGSAGGGFVSLLRLLGLLGRAGSVGRRHVPADGRHGRRQLHLSGAGD